MREGIFLLLLTAACTENIEPMSSALVQQTIGKQGWQVQGNLYVGNPNTTVKLSANFPETGYYTAQFNVTNLPLNGVVTATAIWSVEGNSVQRVISVSSGTTISGPGQGVNIVINDNTTVFGSGAGEVPQGTPYSVSVQVSPGSRPSGSNPPILIGQPNGAIILPIGPSSVSFPVPQNSGVTSIEIVAMGEQPVAGYAQPNIIVEQLNAGGVIYATYNPVGAGFVPIAPGVASVKIHNLDTSNYAYAQIFWGIDG